ncbi:TetR/AcrR family transcriptional regulator C-terminal domain-containing protein [[Actinomadura] parvosata]|uniref:TetR/AcrR family transcriptional regulator C-terminal domain-containing protein n=1 Tax=[Actinomadura] parvosata TaxID=1955412 RepID=UPI00406C4B26
MPRETLTQDQIVRTAVELLDNEGIEGLSMRQLGTRLNSAATAVYWHVKSKDNLLVLAADAVWAEIELPDLEEVSWQSAATAMAKGLFAMILRHPWLVPAMSTHFLYGPGKARHDDHLLAVYQAAGFTGRDAEQAMKTVFTFVLGNALGVASEAAWRARLRRTGGDEQEQVRDMMERATEIAMRFPRLRAHNAAQQDDSPAPAPDQELDFGLRTILNGLQAELGTRPS